MRDRHRLRPFAERLIDSIRREYPNQACFWNTRNFSQIHCNRGWLIRRPPTTGRWRNSRWRWICGSWQTNC